MTGLIGWAVDRARMICALVLLSVAGGLAAYVGLPKEGSPNIDIPVLYVSVTLPGVSAEGCKRIRERLLASLRSSLSFHPALACVPEGTLPRTQGKIRRVLRVAGPISSGRPFVEE